MVKNNQEKVIMNLKAKKDKIILKDVEIFEKQSGGFDVKNTNNHSFGVIHAVPKAHMEDFSVGETVILRDRVIPETLTVDDVKYSFVQPIDILCQID